MKIRDLQLDDIAALDAIGAGNGYEYPNLGGLDIEAAQVVVDEDGRIIAAAAAKRINELYLWSSDVHCPITKLNALRMLHEGMGKELKNKGYTESNIFLPPSLERSFGKRLERTFSWKRNWASWFKRF